jgi:hypothetical protein
MGLASTGSLTILLMFVVRLQVQAAAAPASGTSEESTGRPRIEQISDFGHEIWAALRKHFLGTYIVLQACMAMPSVGSDSYVYRPINSSDGHH